MRFNILLPLLLVPALSYSSDKIHHSYGNPIVDYIFFADPTCVEYEGRLYVYGTNDTQQMLLTSPDSPNTYEKISSICVVSTDDMVNWTYHGTIDVKKAAPNGIGVSWAPTVISREEPDGLTHFYMFYSASGSGVGLITATSPLGPWHDPLGHEFVHFGDPAIGDCPNPFDPGAVIDENGVGWLALGAGKNSTGSDFFTGSQRIVRLADDMIHPASDFIEIKAPYHFEANELNRIGDKYVYIYNTSWVDRDDWNFDGKEAPTRCSMCYMTSSTPLVSDSWAFQDNILRNPGDEGFDYSNNHTHLHKYKGNWYMFYHTLDLQKRLGVTGGYRSIAVDRIDVDEENVRIGRGSMSREGVNQLCNVEISTPHPASMSSATENIVYEPTDAPGEMIVHATAPGQAFRVSGISAPSDPYSNLYVTVKGHGRISLHADSPDGPVIASVDFDSDNDWSEVSSVLLPDERISAGGADICFTFDGGDFLFREWHID